MKNKYLVVYDYDTGGVWSVFASRTKDEIVQKYPELKVVDERPKWMDDASFDKISEARTYDIDEAPSGWLAELIRNRTA